MTNTVGMQRDGVLLSEDKELQVREDGVFIRSLPQPDKNILLTYNRFYCSYNILSVYNLYFCIFVFVFSCIVLPFLAK